MQTRLLSPARSALPQERDRAETEGRPQDRLPHTSSVAAGVPGSRSALQPVTLGPCAFCVEAV